MRLHPSSSCEQRFTIYNWVTDHQSGRPWLRKRASCFVTTSPGSKGKYETHNSYRLKTGSSWCERGFTVKNTENLGKCTTFRRAKYQHVMCSFLLQHPSTTKRLRCIKMLKTKLTKHNYNLSSQAVTVQHIVMRFYFIAWTTHYIEVKHVVGVNDLVTVRM